MADQLGDHEVQQDHAEDAHEVQVALHGLGVRCSIVDVHTLRDAERGVHRKRIWVDILLEPKSFVLSFILRLNAELFDSSAVIIQRSLHRRDRIDRYYDQEEDQDSMYFSSASASSLEPDFETIYGEAEGLSEQDEALSRSFSELGLDNPIFPEDEFSTEQSPVFEDGVDSRSGAGYTNERATVDGDQEEPDRSEATEHQEDADPASEAAPSDNSAHGQNGEATTTKIDFTDEAVAVSSAPSLTRATASSTESSSSQAPAATVPVSADAPSAETTPMAASGAGGSVTSEKKVVLLCRAAERLRFGIVRLHRKDEKISSKEACIIVNIVGYSRGANPSTNRLKAFLNTSSNLAFFSEELSPDLPVSHLVDRSEIDSLTGFSLFNAKRYRQAGEMLQRASKSAWNVATSFPDLAMRDWALSLEVMALYSYFEHDQLLPETTIGLQQLAMLVPRHLGTSPLTINLLLNSALDPEGVSMFANFQYPRRTHRMEETACGARAILTSLYRPLCFIFARVLLNCNHFVVQTAAVKMLEYVIEQVGCALSLDLSCIIECLLFSYSQLYDISVPNAANGDRAGQTPRDGGANDSTLRSSTSMGVSSNSDAGIAASRSRLAIALDEAFDSICRLLPLIDLHILSLILGSRLFVLLSRSLSPLDQLMSATCRAKLPRDPEYGDTVTGYSATPSAALYDASRGRLRRRGLAQALRLTHLMLILIKGDLAIPPSLFVRLFQLLVHSRAGVASLGNGSSNSAAKIGGMGVSGESSPALQTSSEELDSEALADILSVPEVRRTGIHAWDVLHESVALASRGLVASKCQPYMELFCDMLAELFSEKRRVGVDETWEDKLAFINSTAATSMSASRGGISIGTGTSTMVDRDRILTKIEIRDLQALRRLVQFITDFVDHLEPLTDGQDRSAIVTIYDLQRTLARALSRLSMSLMLDIALYEARSSSKLSDETSGYSSIEDEVVDIGFHSPRNPVTSSSMSIESHPRSMSSDKGSIYEVQLSSALALMDSVWQSHSLVVALLPDKLHFESTHLDNSGYSAALKEDVDEVVPGETVLNIITERMNYRAPPMSLLRMLVVIAKRMSEAVSSKRSFLCVENGQLSTNLTLETRDRILGSMVALLRAFLPWVPHAQNEEIFVLLDELLPACISSLTAVDMIRLQDALADQSSSSQVQSVDATLRLLAVLVSKVPPRNPRVALDSVAALYDPSASVQYGISPLNYLSFAGVCAVSSTSGSDTKKQQKQVVHRRLGPDSFPRAGFGVGEGSALTSVQSSLKTNRPFVSFHLHVVMFSCFDAFDAFCKCSTSKDHGFRVTSERLDHFLEQAAFLVRCLRSSVLPHAAVDHRPFLSACIGDVFSTCLMMLEHLDARVRLIGLEIFIASVEILLVTSLIDVPSHYTVNGETDGPLQDVPLPRGSLEKSVHMKAKPDAQAFEEKAWGMLSMFVVSVLAKDAHPDLDLQFAVIKYLRNCLMRALLASNGANGSCTLQIDQITMIWDAVCARNYAPWRDLSLQSHIVSMILVNAALASILSTSVGSSQLRSRVATFTSFAEHKLFVWVEEHLKGRSRQHRMWGARVLENYMQAIVSNELRLVSRRLPRPPVRVWRALRSLRQDWYIDLSLLADSLLEVYLTQPAEPADATQQQQQQQQQLRTASSSGSVAREDLAETLLIWFPDVMEEAMGEVVVDADQFLMSFTNYLGAHIADEDEAVPAMREDSVLSAHIGEERDVLERAADAVIDFDVNHGTAGFITDLTEEGPPAHELPVSDEGLSGGSIQGGGGVGVPKKHRKPPIKVTISDEDENGLVGFDEISELGSST
ncbi:hypothetical protein FVE85_1277 [Porphyridium purpureum]|uniref:Uncharacterized protein n=1 Tax=Porphyridium purpureum TaxID=35688 RepID=A0A5J4YJ09_PORPP|nr:hypothetical protein FVE85_1277 [Porphyridium purpureum]|eukprot:POR0847..scf251_18